MKRDRLDGLLIIIKGFHTLTPCLKTALENEFLLTNELKIRTLFGERTKSVVTGFMVVIHKTTSLFYRDL